MWGQSLTVTGALDDDLVAGIGQAVQGAVTQDGVVKESQSLISIAGSSVETHMTRLLLKKPESLPVS